MTPRFAQTLRLAAQGAHSTRGSDGVQTGLRLSLGDLLQLHGEASGAVLLLMLALLSVAPLAGAGTVLSLGMLALSWHWLQGRDAMPLPQRLSRITLSPTWTRRCLHCLAWLYDAAARCMRPRWSAWTAPRARAAWALWIALMAVLVFLPLPLGNVLPALSLVLLSLGWMFRDGLAMLLSGAAGLLALVYAASLFHLLMAMADTAWARLI